MRFSQFSGFNPIKYSISIGTLRGRMDQTRRVPRYPFSAPAELIVEDSGAKVLCRVKELSLHGCYLDSSVTLSVKTHTLLKIFGLHEYFEATATVIYTHPLQGMGMTFREVKPTFGIVLQKWLLAAMSAQAQTPGRGQDE